MKISLLLISFAAIFAMTTSAQAEKLDLRPVAKKFCNGKPAQLNPGDSFFVNGQAGFVGMGSGSSAPGSCRVVDFATVLMTGTGSGSGIGSVSNYTVVSTAGRRSSCEGSQILPYQGILVPQKTQIQVETSLGGILSKVTLTNTSDANCKSLVLQF